MLKQRYQKRIEWFNDNNRPEMAPFALVGGNVLVVEGDQYDAWAATDGLDLLRPHFSEIRRSTEPVPRLPADTPFDKLPEWYITVYNTIIARANAGRWAHLIPGAVWIPVETDAEADALSAKDPRALEELVRRIDDALSASVSVPEHEWFCKSGTCSTKHDNLPPAPVANGVQAVEHLFASDKVRAQFAKHAAKGVLLRPWDPRITDQNELRVFARQGKVTGVSQQACYSVVSVMHMVDPKEIVAAAQRCFDAMMAGLDPKLRFDYECTFDAFFTTDPDTGDVEVHLIEINSEAFGWGPAGASLFHWESDPPPSSDQTPVFYIMTSY